MLPKRNSTTGSAIRVFLVAFLTVCCVHSATCLGSDQPPGPNDADAGRSSEIAAARGRAADENGQSDTLSGEETGNAQGTSSGDPNSDAETPAAPTRDGQNAGGRSESEPLGSRLWGWLVNKKMIALYVALGVALIILIGWFFLVRREVVRTRLKVKATLMSDPELTRSENGKVIAEFLIVFNWTQKVLYLPTILASLLAAVLICVIQPEPTEWFTGEMDLKMVRMIELIGGIWLGIFFLNFLIEEYNIRLMVIITSLVSAGFLILWLYLSGWLDSFFRLFKYLDVFMSWTGYLLVAVIGLLTILVSWIKGLFYYVTITPNYINLQEGLTETGTQIARRDFSTSVDTTDLLERLLGFGKIKITFKRSEREPVILYVWRIGAKAKKLEEMGTKTIVT